MNSKNMYIFNAQARHLNYMGVLRINMSDPFKEFLPVAPSQSLKDKP
jgi:hypothetical protein